MAHLLGSQKMALDFLFSDGIRYITAPLFNSGQDQYGVIFNLSVIDNMFMKPIFAIAILAMATLSSCVVRVDPPLDPVTMNPSCKFCPQNYYAGHPSSCSACGSVATRTSVHTK